MRSLHAQLPSEGVQGWRACAHPNAQPGCPTRGAPPAAARQLHLLLLALSRRTRIFLFHARALLPTTQHQQLICLRRVRTAQALTTSDPASLAIYAGVVGIIVLLSPVLGPLLGRVVRGYAGNVSAAAALDQLNTVCGPDRQRPLGSQRAVCAWFASY